MNWRCIQTSSVVDIPPPGIWNKSETDKSVDVYVQAFKEVHSRLKGKIIIVCKRLIHILKVYYENITYRKETIIYCIRSRNVLWTYQLLTNHDCYYDYYYYSAMKDLQSCR